MIDRDRRGTISVGSRQLLFAPPLSLWRSHSSRLDDLSRPCPSAARLVPFRLSEEPDTCYCSSKKHGADAKSQSKGLPWRSSPPEFLALEASALEFLALEFFVEPFDISERCVNAVSRASRVARLPAIGAMCSRVHGVSPSLGVEWSAAR